MVVNETELDQSFRDEWEKLQREVQKPGILLAGASGVGKSSLVNMIFGDNVAEVGVGKPVTQDIDMHETAYARLYDSKGSEIQEGGDKEFIEKVMGMVKDSSQHKVNIIWYCVSASGGRFSDYDRENVLQLSKSGCPICVVLTKVDNAEDEDIEAIKNAIHGEEGLENIKIFETTNNPECKQYDQSSELIEWSAEKLPDQLKVSFISQQQNNFEMKRKQVVGIIAQHVAGAGIVGFSPVPFSDAPILAVNETTLMARILSVYNLGGLENAVKGIGFEGLLTLAGKSLAGSLLKLIPVIGTIIGGAINASVAVAITWAFGGAVALACEQAWKAKLDGNAEELERILNNFGKTVQKISEDNVRNKKTDDKSIFKD